jgi:hypothetical protein
LDTWLYIALGLMPRAAGWLQDKMASAAAPLIFTAVLAAAMLPLYWLFALAPRKGRPQVGPLHEL